MRKVLAIDGGGIKGVIPAAFLSEIEEKLNVRVQDYFDLVVGTSTGGIIALALGLGFKARDILDFYEEWGPEIFPEERYKRRLWRRSFSISPIYDIETLKEAVQATFGQRRFGHSELRLVIPSFDVNAGKLYIWKTAHHMSYKSDYQRSAVEVALSTAAAPGFFQTYRSPGGEILVDGGIWANCPVLVAVMEAVYRLEWNPDDLFILSLGCSKTPLDVGNNKRKATGTFQWLSSLVDLSLYAQAESALGMAQMICPNITRVNPLTPNGWLALDNAAKIKEMKGIGKIEARRLVNQIEECFFSVPASPFVPCYQVS